MNWYSIFYWLTVADSIKKFFDAISNIFTFFTIIFALIMIVSMIGKAIRVANANNENEEDDKKDSETRGWEIARKLSARLFYPSLIICIVTWLCYTATPTKKDCLFIVAGGAVGNFMTSDTSARQLPGDVTKFLHMSLQSEISSLGDDVKRELGVQTPKEKLLEKVKQMSKDELVAYLQSDSTLLK